MTVRKRSLPMGIALVSMIVLAGCGSTPGAGGAALEPDENDITQIRLVSTMTFNSGLAALAVFGDAPEAMGLNFETVTISDSGSSNQVAALLAGSADVGSMGINTVVDAIVGGADLQIIGGSSNSMQSLVISNDAIERLGVDMSGTPQEIVGQLGGATIAAGAEGSSGNFSMRAILKDAGLDADADVELVPLADSLGSVAAGLENGQYDVTFAALGSGEAAVLRGNAETILTVPLGEAEIFEGNINSVFVTSRKLAEEQPELLEKIREATRAVANQANNEPEVAGQIIRDNVYPDMDEELWTASWESASQGYPEEAIYDEDNWDTFVRIFDDLSPNDYASLNFEDIVNPVATK